MSNSISYMSPKGRVGAIPMSWEVINQIIAENKIEELYREPGLLDTYFDWKVEINKKYGGTFRYVLIEKLGWLSSTHIIGTPIHINSVNSEFLGSYKDIKILENDFPYYIDNGIRHLVIWFKCPIPLQSNVDDMTLDAKSEFEKFIDDLFFQKLGIEKENLAWFRNTTPLQSIKEIGHLHVMIRDITNEHKSKIDELIGTSGLVDE